MHLTSFLSLAIGQVIGCPSLYMPSCRRLAVHHNLEKSECKHSLHVCSEIQVLCDIMWSAMHVCAYTILWCTFE